MSMYEATPVFGLDIGTRSVVGTVGYKRGDNFVVVAQEIREHQTRAMLDGQIHDRCNSGSVRCKLDPDCAIAAYCTAVDGDIDGSATSVEHSYSDVASGLSQHCALVYNKVCTDIIVNHI